MQPPRDPMSDSNDAIDTDQKASMNLDSSKTNAAVSKEDGGAVSEFHRQKLRERREEWQINSRVAAISAGIAAALLIFGTASYFYNSSAAAQTFRMRAEEASSSGDAAEESRWWSRYLMMVPDDSDAIIKVALAADAAAESAKPDELASVLASARRRLSESVARLPSERSEDREKLRRRHIRRLIQSGGYWFREAENQIIELNPSPDDVFASKAFALALYGRIQQDLYNKNENYIKKGTPQNYWDWLARQKPTLALRRAVQLAPDDLDVVAAFLSAVRSDIDLFAAGVSAQDPSDLTEDEQQWLAQIADRDTLIQQSIDRLSKEGSSRANLILYSYGLGGDQSNRTKAEQVLIQVAPQIASRLQQANSGDRPTPSDELTLVSDDANDLSLTRVFADDYWDYQCLLEAARLVAAQATLESVQTSVVSDGQTSSSPSVTSDKAQLARQWYATLMAATVSDVTAKMRENTFLYAGMLEEFSGNGDRAVELWKSGLVNTSPDNLELNGAIATTLAGSASTDAEIAEAMQAVGSFGKAIQAESARLLLSTTMEMSEGQRNQVGRIIELARWRHNVAAAQLQIRQGGGTELTSQAIAMLRSALESNAEVRPLEKAQLADLLASLYTSYEVWDLAADALSKACDLVPKDTARHVRAGEAWTRAGNRSRAAEHWRLAGASAALDIRVKAAQAEFEFQLRMPPAVREFSGLRTTLDLLEKEFEPIAAAGPSETMSVDAIDGIDTSLRILKMSLPPIGVLAEQHLSSREIALFADELAAGKLDNAAIQAYAAERLSAVGMVDEATVRLDRMEEILGAGSTPLVIVKSRIDASNGKPASAAQQLLAQMDSSPNNADQLARLAANYALASRDVAMAYEAMQRIPNDRRLPNDLYGMYRQAKQLAVSTDDSGTADKLNKEAENWLAALKVLEEPQSDSDVQAMQRKSVGTFWRMIEVENNLAEMRSKTGKIDRTDKTMMQTRVLLDAILAQRPRWGTAIAMRGYILAILQDHEAAIDQLRAGIAAGDASLRTRQLLLEQLISLGRDSEADEEMKRMAESVDFVVDPYAKQDIQSAFNRGELLSAVESARQAITDNPADSMPLIVFARVASTAVQMDRDKGAEGKNKASLSEEKRQQLVQEARDAIEKAGQLGKENELALAASSLDLEFRHGTPDSVDAVFNQINSSGLPKHQRLLLSARVLLFKGDIDAAIDTLHESNKELPSIATQVQLASLYQIQGRSVDVVQTLRDAVKMQPDNQQLRGELAKAIVVNQGEDADWDEVEQLLQVGSGATAEDKFLLATLLSARGDTDQLVRALGLAKELLREDSSSSYESSVLQVTILAKLIADHDAKEDAAKDPARRARYLDEAKSVSQRLANARSSQAIDLYRYGALLLNYGNEDDLKTVKSLSEQLQVMSGGMLQSLELRIIYNQRVGNAEQLPGLVDGWVKDVKPDQDRYRSGGAETAAGTLLITQGFVEQGIAWFEKAYEANDEILSNYVVALTKVGQHQKAAEISATHYESHGDAASATWLVEAMLAMPGVPDNSKYLAVIKDASEKHNRNAPFLESVATLAMQRGKPEDAIKLYQQVLSFDAVRIRSLNNLAMAYAQMPGLATEGLAPIDRALKLTKRNPELLDTKGLVLLKAGRNQEALTVFEEAIAATNEPRFYFHKILSLLALQRSQDAKKLWDSLDVSKLDVSGLTPEEQAQLQEMKTDFESFAGKQI